MSALAAPPTASQSKSLPLPRTRSRAGSRTNANANANADSQASAAAAAAAPAKGQRATSKPRSTGKRASSVGPTAAAGGRKGTRANPGGLAAVDEQPGEASQPAASQPQPQPQPQPQSQTQTQRPPTFRSGTLPLPRRQQIQSQVQSQAQIAALAAGRFGEDEGPDVKVKRELLDAAPPLTQSQSQSQSQSGEAWNGFQLNSLELLTQKPFPSQSQGWGPSQ